MTTPYASSPTSSTSAPADAASYAPAVPHKRQTVRETKPAYKTTEFLTYLATVAGVLVAAWLIGRDNESDIFRADRAWLYVTMLTIGYMISRGLAKSGSRERYDSSDYR